MPDSPSSPPSFDSLLSPAMLMRSFLNVASGCVLNLIAVYAIFIGLAAFVFPKVFKLLTTLEPDAFQMRLINSPEEFFPPAMFWSVLVLYSLASLAIGWLSAKLAPFSAARHTTILAGLLFIGFLQQAIGCPAEMRGVCLAFMLVAPIATLIGGRMALGPDSSVSDEQVTS